MSHSPSLARGHALPVALPRVSFIVGIVIAASAAAVISSVATMAWMGAGPAAAEPRKPPAPPVVQPSPDTSVPDASQVFKGREVPVEEPVPTF